MIHSKKFTQREIIIILFLLIAVVTVKPATATSIDVTNYDTVSLDGYSLIVDAYTSPYLSLSTSEPVGNLTVSVYYNDSTKVYLYELLLDPGSYYDPADNEPPATHDISIINVPSNENYSLNTNLRAGYSFEDASSATGAPLNPDNLLEYAFFIDSDESNPDKIRLITNTAYYSWSGPADDVLPITFFFESYLEPVLSTYSIINCEASEALNYAPAVPVPEPGAMLLLLTGLIGFTARRLKSITLRTT